jgi:hypothetical protein
LISCGRGLQSPCFTEHLPRVRPFAVALGIVSLLAVGCRPSMPRIATPADSTADPRFIDVQIDNHNWSDVVIYVVHSGQRTRLGTAGTARSTELRFPASYVFADRVSLLATPIGSPARFESERFKVAPGQRVILTVESSIGHSSLMIR